jgi:hypothetical protein
MLRGWSSRYEIGWVCDLPTQSNFWERESIGGQGSCWRLRLSTIAPIKMKGQPLKQGQAHDDATTPV